MHLSGPTISGSEPLREATTGKPAAIASSAANGMTSPPSDGITAIAAPPRSACSSAASSLPSSSVFGRPRSSAASGPSPAILSGTPLISAASAATANPFSTESLPKATAYEPCAALDRPVVAGT